MQKDGFERGKGCLGEDMDRDFSEKKGKGTRRARKGGRKERVIAWSVQGSRWRIETV
jgi:hypothetical protein